MTVSGESAAVLRPHLEGRVANIVGNLSLANAAREAALPRCRAVIRLSGSSIRAVHRQEWARAAGIVAEAEAELRQAQTALKPFPAVAFAGFLHDAEKEFVEASLVGLLIRREGTLAGPEALMVDPRSWMRGLAEAASELRRFMLDRLREGDVARAEQLLAAMDDVHDCLVVVDFPDAMTGGLRRTLDALRAVLERSRGDLTTTMVQYRLQQALEGR